MVEKKVRSPKTEDGLLEAALAAEQGGQLKLAEQLFSEATALARAAELAIEPVFYWVEGADLMVESTDGRGPCSVLQVVQGEFDLTSLASKLNAHARGQELVPDSGLVEEARFVQDSEYLYRKAPAVTLMGFVPFVLEALNSKSEVK